MAEDSAISWTDHTFNPWRGCTKVSPACSFCYADRLAKRNPATLGVWGDKGTRVLASEAMWKKPIKWSAAAASLPRQIVKPGSVPVEYIPVPRPKVFCASLADVFEDWKGPIVNSKGERLYAVEGEVPVTMSDVRERLFSIIDQTPWLDWLLLTKRPENIRRMWRAVKVQSQEQADDRNERGEMFRRNVWLGTTVENQEYADKRLPELLRCEDFAPVLFVSCEPLLGPVDLTSINAGPNSRIDALRGWDAGRITRGIKPMDAKIDWVITGGESGGQARPSNPSWYRQLLAQCRDTGTAFHHKQNGEWLHSSQFSGEVQSSVQIEGTSDDYFARVGVEKAGRLLDGNLYDQFPVVAI